jgi:hypothetical protein
MAFNWITSDTEHDNTVECLVRLNELYQYNWPIQWGDIKFVEAFNEFCQQQVDWVKRADTLSMKGDM